MKHSTQTRFLAKKYGVERAVDMITGVGFDVDISFQNNLFDLTDRSLPSRIIKIVGERGKSFVQAHAPYGGGYDNYTQNLIPTFPRVFEIAAELGIPNVVVHPLQQGRYYGNEERLFDMNMEFYHSLLPLSKATGVRIAIENMWQRHPITSVICDDVCAPPDDMARYYDTLNDPEHFTVCLDLGHTALCGREPENVIRKLGSRIGCIHAQDVNYQADLHMLPGSAKIKWDNVCRALAEVNYPGTFNLEADCFYENFLPEQYETVLKFMNDIAKSFAAKIEEYKAQ